MMDYSIILKYMISPVIIIFVLFIGSFILFGSAFVRKQKKFRFPCLLIVKTGEGKVSVQTMKAGWFKTRWFPFNSLKLYDYGSEEELLAGGFRKPELKILAGSSFDFHEINGKRGLICRRKDDDPKILVPLSELEIVNDQILGKIANAEYRDAVIDLVKQAENETKGKWEQFLPYIALGLTVIFCFLSIIVVSRMNATAITEAKELLLKAAEQGITIRSSGAP